MGINFDITGALQFLERKAAEVQAAAVSGMHDATDHLLIVSTDEAPLDKGPLRMTAGKDVSVKGGKVVGEVFFSATEQGKSGVRFNYALRVHEMGEYKNPTTPGTRPKFLARPLQANERLYQQFISDAVRRVLR